MKKNKKSFLSKQNQRGGMLIELMMSIALAAMLIPFIFRYQENTIARAKNIAVVKQMESVQQALERYIIENKSVLMKPVGKNISRVRITDLVNYGLPEEIAQTYKNDFQLRVLKSMDKNDKSVLQGIIILNDENITPLRTREIVNIGGEKFGFIEGGETYGGFGAFHANTADLGVGDTKGIVGVTQTTRGNNEYLWRVPSENKNDSTMLSPLNLDGHDINNVRFFGASKAQFEEKLSISKITMNSLVFTNRSTLETIFSTSTALVNGPLTADSRTMNVYGTLSLADTAKFSSFSTNDLYVNDMTLNGFSVNTTSDKEPVLKVIGDMDLVFGRVNAGYVSVGYTGSVTPRLSVTDKIQDSKDSSFYWDIKNKKARFVDASFPELSRMAQIIYAMESKSGTQSSLYFGGVVANTNATVGDYLNALSEIQTRVREKYQMLKL